jgi:hypothetical protein
MQLSEFISGTLVQIANGIDEANKQLDDSIAQVNPSGVQVGDERIRTAVYGHIVQGRYDAPPSPVVHLIRFDVAVYAAEGAEKNGDAVTDPKDLA